MANREFGGKIRPKRTHTLSKPYDRRKSFLNKFTDTVKDILVPSWLSDFMKGKSAAENTQNHFGQEQNGNEIKENEENDNYLTPEPNPSDRRPAQPRPLHPEFSNYHQSQTQSNSTRPNLSNYGSEHLLPSHKVQYHPPEPRFSTPTNSAMANDVLLPHTENTDVFPSPLMEKRNYLRLSEAEVDQLRNRLHSTNDTNATTSTHLQQQATDDNELDDEEASGSASVEQEDLIADLDRSEAWNSSYLRGRTNNRGSHGKRASFEPSLFGSPFMKNSLLSDSLHESPFYSGKTRYGGAAANRKLRLKVSNPYTASMPYRKQVNAKPLKSSTSAVTSSTAKIILDTLEMMATPISDAHRIPMANNTFTDSVLQFTPSSLKRRNRQTVAASMFDSNSQKLPSRGPPSVMCNSPSIAAIARNRQTQQQKLFHSEPKKKLAEKTKPIEEDSIQQRNMDKHIEKQSDKRTPTFFREAKESAPEPAPARKPLPSATVAVSFKDNVESSSPFGSSTGGKMKRDKSYNFRGSAVRGDDDDDGEEEPVQLETKFILPVTEMPKFSFGDNLSTPMTKSSESSLPTTSLIRPPLNSLSTTSTVVTSAATTSPDLFTFSSPIIKKAPALFQSSASSLDFKFSTPTKAKDWEDTPQQTTFQYSSASNLPKPKFSSPPSTSLKTSPQLKSGSVMEALSGAKKTDYTSSPTTDNFSSGFLTAKTLKTSGSVMDVLGGGNKSLTNSSSSPFSGSNSGSVFGGLQPASTLKTGSVMDVLSKQGTGEDTRQTEEEKDLDDTSTEEEEEEEEEDEDEDETEEKDEDDTLLAKGNERGFEGCESDQKSQIHSDETASPVTSSATSTLQTEPDPFMSKFIKPAGSWECAVCMIENTPDATKCEACETPKPTPITKPPPKPLTTSSISKPDELMAKFTKPTGTWECSTCLVENDAEMKKCCACETARPGQTAATLSDAAIAVSQKADPLMAKFMKPVGCWECDVCMIQNQPSSYKCEACQTPNPNAAPPPSGSAGTVSLVGAVTSSPPSSSSSSLPLSTANRSVATAKGSLDKPLWKCDTCLVSNLPQFYKCIACDTPRIKPAVMATMAANSSGSADVLPKFGSGVVTNSNFKFGSSSDSSAAVTSSEGFKFGSSSSTSESAGTFKFGTTSTASTETSKAFVFGQSAAAVDEKKKSSDNSGFKFQSSGVSLAASSTPPFTFGSEIKTQPSVEEKTQKESGFSQQPSTLNFSFGGGEKKTAESPAPLFGTPTHLSTGLGAFATQPKPPETSSNEDKGPTPSPVIPASTSQAGFSFGSAPVNTTGSTSIFTVPNSINSATSSLPSKAALPFGTQPTSLQQQQLPKPMFGFADKTDSSKTTEAVAPQPFSFISTNEQPNQSTNKTPFAASSVLKRQRDDESDGPSGAKRSFGSSPAPAANPGGFGSFNFSVAPAAAKSDNSGFTNSFNAASSGQFQFGGTATNSTATPFGGASSMTAANPTPTTTASGFGSPSFNFVTSTTAPKPMSSGTSQQPFVFGSSPAPFSAGASSENTFGNKGSVFGTTGSSVLFDSKSTSKGFGATPAAPTATNAPFVFGSNANPSFNFSAGGSGPSPGGIYQFSGKQAEPSHAVANNANIYQFGQIPSTNNAPLGANTSSVAPSSGVNFNVKPNFNFSEGVGGDFNLGATKEANSLNNRRFKKAVRRTKN